MKRILGLDLGTTSIGWALVNESEDFNNSNIIKLGVRVIPLTTDEQTDFEKGNPLSVNAERTNKRGARRNLQRFKLRRAALIDTLLKNSIIDRNTPLTEIGKNTTHSTLAIRNQATTKKISLEELARVFLMINKKRGYKSNRKANNSDEEGQIIDGMSIAKTLYDDNLTPGEYVLQQLNNSKRYVPDFYRSDLKEEFNKVWNTQKEFYSEILTEHLYKELEGKGSKATWAICKDPFRIVGIKLNAKREELKKLKYKLRVNAIKEKLELEHLAIVLQEINNDLKKSSGYLGDISDRSKTLYFNKITVGQYLFNQISKNPHTQLKKQVFYRQDYLDEFETIWETQAIFHKELTPSLKKEIRDTIIFYQRKLKSKKGEIAYCQFESWETIKKVDGKIVLNKLTKEPKKRTIGYKVTPKSSPLFQEFKIWQILNNLHLIKKENLEVFEINIEDKKIIFEELNLRGKLKQNEVLNILGLKTKFWKLNYETIEGNNYNQALYNALQNIATDEGYGHDWAKKTAQEILTELRTILPELGINESILNFNALLENEEFIKQKSYQLWHLLYATEEEQKISEEDKVIYGNNNVALKKALEAKFGFKPKHAAKLINIKLQDDYGSLSSKAIKKIIPHLIEGNDYSQSCALAGYNHSNSLSKAENENRVLKDALELLPKNALRNPVVEKILNEMINLFNQVTAEYGKPDEVRIELARELKKSAKERKEMTTYISKATKINEDIKKTIKKDFGFNATKNDIVKYKLYEELKENAYKTLFSNQKIDYWNDLFSKKVEIEHIIPKAILFDDSFSNKTLAYQTVNLKKRNRTAIDFISEDYNSELENYKLRVESLFKAGNISGSKYKKLTMSAVNLPKDFIERDLRNSQYIAKKAKELFYGVCKHVHSTSGSITAKLREDWDLINVMKELNLPKYRALGLTEFEERKNNKKHELIKGWTKRNDHRHHAMDALTVAFTTIKHIQYINNLNAKGSEKHKDFALVKGLERGIKKDSRFISPMKNFRSEAKNHIQDIFISFKAKNKVVTSNINKTKVKGGYHQKMELTPRGQLHKETIYGKRKFLMAKPTKLSKLNNIELISCTHKKIVIKQHLEKYENDFSIAFNTKTLKKDPILFKNKELKEVHCYEYVYTIKKDVTPDLKIDKVLDPVIKKILEARLIAFGGDAKKAFSDLEENPIWQNKEKGMAIKKVTIKIKKVTIKGVNNDVALHHKKDHLGNKILTENGETQAVDYVQTGNNHHIAIYKDENGNLQEAVVSLFEAVEIVNQDLPIIDKSFKKNLGWKFLFTLKQNEMFVFPNVDFNPDEIDLKDPNNAKIISPNLFRVQSISSKDYIFSNHLESMAINKEIQKTKELKGVSFYRMRKPQDLDKIIKVRINHIGQIVKIGEY